MFLRSRRARRAGAPSVSRATRAGTGAGPAPGKPEGDRSVETGMGVPSRGTSGSDQLKSIKKQVKGVIDKDQKDVEETMAVLSDASMMRNPMADVLKKQLELSILRRNAGAPGESGKTSSKHARGKSRKHGARRSKPSEKEVKEAEDEMRTFGAGSGSTFVDRRLLAHRPTKDRATANASVKAMRESIADMHMLCNASRFEASDESDPSSGIAERVRREMEMRGSRRRTVRPRQSLTALTGLSPEESLRRHRQAEVRAKNPITASSAKPFDEEATLQREFRSGYASGMDIAQRAARESGVDPRGMTALARIEKRRRAVHMSPMTTKVLAV